MVLSELLAAPSNDRHELLPGTFVREEGAAQDVRLHERRLLLDPAHHHAEVRSSHPDGKSFRLEDPLDRIGDLMGEMLL